MREKKHDSLHPLKHVRQTHNYISHHKDIEIWPEMETYYNGLAFQMNHIINDINVSLKQQKLFKINTIPQRGQ